MPAVLARWPRRGPGQPASRGAAQSGRRAHPRRPAPVKLGASAPPLGWGETPRTQAPPLVLKAGGRRPPPAARVAAGGGAAARLRHRPQQEIGESAARLERAGLLQKLQLEDESDVAEAEVA